jgi:hypothetical protein
MVEQPPKKRFEEVSKDPDEGLFKDIGPDHKFNRLRTTDPKRLARKAKLIAIRAIDIDTGKFAAAKQYFDGLIDRVEGGIEGHCLVIYGRTGAGKTHIVNQLLKHPDLQPKKTPEGLYRPLLKVVAPAPCTLRTLGLRILHRLGYRPRKSLRENEVWDRVEANLAAQGVAILVIDEMHNVLKGRNVKEREKIAMTLKSLMVSETNPMQLVLSGLSDLKKFIDLHGEVRRRSHFLELTALRPLKDDTKLIGFLSGLERTIGMKTCGFVKSDMPQRFLMASRGLVGRMAYFVQEAATIAVSLNDTEVSQKYLAEAYKRPYAASARKNPFLIANIRDFRLPKTLEDLDEDDKTFLRGIKQPPEDEADDDAAD